MMKEDKNATGPGLQLIARTVFQRQDRRWQKRIYFGSL
jgi:hypothetical protein